MFYTVSPKNPVPEVMRLAFVPNLVEGYAWNNRLREV